MNANTLDQESGHVIFVSVWGSVIALRSPGMPLIPVWVNNGAALTNLFWIHRARCRLALQ